jgi:hypothetical protein
MIAILSRHQMICLMLLLVSILSSCASDQVQTEEPVPPVVVEEPEPMSLLLACAPANSNRALTRLADEVVQNNDYRDITQFRFIALKNGIVTDCSIDNPSNSTTGAIRYYHSTYCSMVVGSDGCLVYAKAKDVAKDPPAATLKYNGSLNAVIPNQVQSTNQIQFNLESILDATEARETGDDRANWEIEAWALADALTAIVNDSHNEGSTLVWKTSTNVILKNLLQRFTNSGADLPGSAASVKQWMLSLSNAADSYLENPPTSIGDDEKTLLGIIKTKADEKAATITVSPETSATLYPRDINLPDGAAALRWTGEKFEPQMQTTTLDDINSVSRFVYPPALYYFVESGLWTSNTARTFENYQDKSHWKATEENDADAVQSLFSDGNKVEKNTKTVAIADPLQYAVAHLTMRVQAEAASLPYETGNENKIDISKLTLKGVIIGGQRPVGYDFKPTSNSLYDVSFIYDSQVSGALTDSSDPKTYHTLALQSYDGENVNIILEFEYSGDTGFKCLNGYVYPGTRFYLVGVLDPSQGDPPDGLTEEEKTELKKRVFTQDYTTAINMEVTSLEKAYNVLPSLLSNSLEIGVIVTPQWISAEPSEPVILD